jgi:hypothetical protein
VRKKLGIDVLGPSARGQDVDKNGKQERVLDLVLGRRGAAGTAVSGFEDLCDPSLRTLESFTLGQTTRYLSKLCSPRPEIGVDAEHPPLLVSSDVKDGGQRAILCGVEDTVPRRSQAPVRP